MKGLVNCSREQVPDPDDYDSSSDSEISLPVGEQHLVEIPALMSRSNYCKLQENSYGHDPLRGLAIPLNNGMQVNRGKGHYLVPGSLSNHWNEKEEDIFILALYIFGKVFDKVKRFIGSRKMGDILSFYYEKFCKSDKHRKWKEWKKSHINDCVFGENMFLPPCQHKILSRLRHNVTQECYIAILEVSWLYAESKVTLEDYAFALKKLVGVDTLVEVIAIGKGKRDITVPIVEKLTKATRKLPFGRDCSRLTHREIIHILTNFTLRKARSKDLFWQAVWPRLQARGWHSEQQKDSHHKYAASSSSSFSYSSNKLLFFAPRVGSFSTRLVKGNHYFDSISDVLKKVASNPGTIEVPTVEAKGKMTELGSLPVIVTKASTGIYISNNLDTQKVEQGVDTIGKGKGVASEVKGVASEVNTRTKMTRTRQPTTKMLEALESEEYRPIENRKRSNSLLQGSSAAIPPRNTRRMLAGESSRRSEADGCDREKGQMLCCAGSRNKF